MKIRSLLPVVALACSLGAAAAPVTYDFTGNLSLAVGSLPAGSYFSGSFTYDPSAIGTSTAFNGGTQTTFAVGAVTDIAVSIGGFPITSLPGSAILNNNLNVPVPVSYPNGDSLDITANMLTTTVKGVTYHTTLGGQPVNFLYMGFNDGSGSVFNGTSLPTSLSLGSFNEAFLGIDFGPLGAGNTSMISNLTSLTPVGIAAVPEPGSWLILALGLSVLGLLRRQRPSTGAAFA